ncbi:iron-sulfur cluster assembly scaffold protein [Desulfuromonas thiophila]|uniref:Nitrogen fixation protein NifU n=1 Tax=Desulfuromonas thiophila TaxID=57664 RepID=A0A1G7A0E8_9BACT|nr:iron-sulfur cluster assembly scaffold protein [Desulfuromonas thiophila]SDE08211.1 NifU-like protein [Desulfuromonas thiophila]
MAKNDLIGGSLWEQYSAKVAERMNNPRHFGELTAADAQRLGGRLVIANEGAESCGDTVRLYWIVRESDERILAATFKSFGCGTAIASTDMMAEMCIGKTVSEATKITNLDVERALRDTADKAAVPPQKMHCSVMAYEVIKRAAALYRNVDIATLQDKDIVCECARVTLQTIEDAIRINDLHTVEEIADYTKAGAFCKSCVRPGGHEKRELYLVDILARVREEMSRESSPLPPPDAFLEQSVVKQIRAIEAALDNDIRPVLARDGGGIELDDVRRAADGSLLVLVQYKGACKGCAGSVAGTLSFVQQSLQERLSPAIRVQVA